MITSILQNRFFIILCFTFIFIRWINIYGLQSSREIPLEADDAFSYIFHAKALDTWKPNSTKFFLSFEILDKKLETNSWPEFFRKRFYHRLKRFYHIGHALYLNLLNKVTFTNYIQTFWISIYLLGACLILIPMIITKKLFGTYASVFSGIIILFSYLEVPHQMTGAPREWTNLFYVCIYFLWRLKLTNKIFALLLTSVMLPLVSFHPIGKPLCLLFLIFSLLMLMFRNQRKKAIISFFITLFAISFYYALYAFFEVTNLNFSYQIKFLPLLGFKSIYLMFFPFFTPNIGIKDAVFQIFMIYPSLIGLIYFSIRKDFIFSLMIMWIIGPHLAFHFLQFEYLPALNYYPLKEYLNTSTIILNSIISAHLLLNVLPNKIIIIHRVLEKQWVPLTTILVLILFIQFSIYPKTFRNYFGDRHNFSSPIDFIKKIDTIVPTNDCIVFRNEYLLYSYYTFSNVDRSVALVLNWEGKILNYSNTDYKKCKYFAIMTVPGEKIAKEPVIKINNYLLLKGML